MTELVGVRLTPDDMADLRAYASELGVTPPEALRLAFRAVWLTEVVRAVEVRHG